MAPCLMGWVSSFSVDSPSFGVAAIGIVVYNSFLVVFLHKHFLNEHK